MKVLYDKKLIAVSLKPATIFKYTFSSLNKSNVLLNSVQIFQQGDKLQHVYSEILKILIFI